MTRTCRKFVCDKFRMTLTVVMPNQWQITLTVTSFQNYPVKEKKAPWLQSIQLYPWFTAEQKCFGFHAKKKILFLKFLQKRGTKTTHALRLLHTINSIVMIYLVTLQIFLIIYLYFRNIRKHMKPRVHYMYVVKRVI